MFVLIDFVLFGTFWLRRYRWGKVVLQHQINGAFFFLAGWKEFSPEFVFCFFYSFFSCQCGNKPTTVCLTAVRSFGGLVVSFQKGLNSTPDANVLREHLKAASAECKAVDTEQKEFRQQQQQTRTREMNNKVALSERHLTNKCP